MSLTIVQLDNYVNHEIKELTLKSMSLKATDIPLICAYLNKHPEITSLDISKNEIADEGAILLAQNKMLSKLNVSNNGIYSDGAEALAKNKSLKCLDISYNKIDYTPNYLDSILSLIGYKYNFFGKAVSALALNTTLTTLSVASCFIGQDDVVKQM